MSRRRDRESADRDPRGGVQTETHALRPGSSNRAPRRGAGRVGRRRAEMAPVARRAERVAALRRWTDYHARLLADPEATPEEL
jgi:hypothetical protein